MIPHNIVLYLVYHLPCNALPRYHFLCAIPWYHAILCLSQHNAISWHHAIFSLPYHDTIVSCVYHTSGSGAPTFWSTPKPLSWMTITRPPASWGRERFQTPDRYITIYIIQVLHLPLCYLHVVGKGNVAHIEQIDRDLDHLGLTFAVMIYILSHTSDRYITITPKSAFALRISFPHSQQKEQNVYLQMM